MGIERHLSNTFIGESKTLDKRWVIRAKDVEDATGKVISFCKEKLADLEKNSPNEDIDVDLSFRILDSDVTEI